MRLVQIQGRERPAHSKHEQPSQSKRDEYAVKCQSCGACCSYYSWRPHGIPVTHGKLADDNSLTFRRVIKVKYQWPDLGNAVRVVRQACAWMRRRKRDGWWQCVALSGHVGQVVKCTIYKKRPAACRKFEPGSENCIRSRAWAELEIEGSI